MDKTKTSAVSGHAGRRVIVAAGLLCLVLGSVHAFSVFLAPLETAYSVSRASASLIYSIALITLTISVLVGPRYFHHLSAGSILLASGLVAAAGTLITAFAPGIIAVVFGYSVLFGAANGVGYGFGLQIAAKANQGREGMAMGIVTACYATGAMIAPAGFQWALSHGGMQTAMLGLCIALIAVSVCGAMIISSTEARLDAPAQQAARGQIRSSEVALLWTGFGASVFSGLMVIGHAAEIARADQLAHLIWMAPALIAGFNLAGSLSGGYLADAVSPKRLLAGLAVFLSGVLALLAVSEPGLPVLAGLACVGFCYGAIISIYPAIIAKRYGMANSPRIYGRVFTAWGAAGLAGPWLAGALFDATGGYVIALATAAGLSLVSAAAVTVLFR
ncbi:MFS transporter [Anderseniella sp. Alg231-50]|uniref:MFS transporter n=1 Tax=Anderseniella sp. Alg231-50 TaxID=1922226 RepID=UPI000D55B9FF